MTIVLKNQTDDNPYTSSGTTLFLKRTVLKSKNNVKQSDEKAKAQEEWVASTDIRSCVDSVRNLQESARNSRESRLMTHLGLKSEFSDTVNFLYGINRKILFKNISCLLLRTNLYN